MAKTKNNQHPGQPLSTDKYYALESAYFECQTILSASKAVGVSVPAATKYINKGDKKRNLPAIKDTWAKNQKEVQKKRGKTYQQAMGEWAETIDQLKSVFSDAVKDLIENESFKTMFKGEATLVPKDLVKALSDLAKLESFVMGGATDRVEIQGEIDKLSKEYGLPIDEIEEMWQDITQDEPARPFKTQGNC